MEKWGKILEKSRNFVSPEKWEPCQCERNIWLSLKSAKLNESLTRMYFQYRMLN